jgi:hypothetical protein
MAAAWMVRAGEGCEVIEEFEKQSCVAIGWHELGDISGVKTAEELMSLMDRTFPEWKPRKRQVSTSMVFKFLHDFSLGDFVASYNSDTRQYLITKILDYSEFFENWKLLDRVSGSYRYSCPDRPHSVSSDSSLGVRADGDGLQGRPWKPPSLRPSEQQVHSVSALTF